MYDDSMPDVVQYYKHRLSPRSTRLLPLTILEQNHRMSVHTGMDTQSNRPPDRLGHPPLVHQSQSRLPVMLDPTKRRDKVTNHGEVLSILSAHLSPPQVSPPIPITKTYPIHIQRINPQQIHHIPRPDAPITLPKLTRLVRAQVLRGVDVALLPETGHHPGELVGYLAVAQLFFCGRLFGRGFGALGTPASAAGFGGAEHVG